MPVTGVDTIGLDPRLRYCDRVRGGGPVEHADGRPGQWVEIYPPLGLDTDERVMLLTVPVVELSAASPGPITIELSQILSWQPPVGEARQADRTRHLGPAGVAADPALLPPMTGEEWDAGLAALRRYRDEIGHCWVPFDCVPMGDHTSVTHLGGWALRVRNEHRLGLLGHERTRQVESVPGWQWSR